MKEKHLNCNPSYSEQITVSVSLAHVWGSQKQVINEEKLHKNEHTPISLLALQYQEEMSVKQLILNL